MAAGMKDCPHLIEPIASRPMRRRAPQANSGESPANRVVRTIFFRATINRREKSSADLRITRRLTHMSSPIFTGASLDKAGENHPLPFETSRDYLVGLRAITI